MLTVFLTVQFSGTDYTHFDVQPSPSTSPERCSVLNGNTVPMRLQGPFPATPRALLTYQCTF